MYTFSESKIFKYWINASETSQALAQQNKTEQYVNNEMMNMAKS